MSLNGRNMLEQRYKTISWKTELTLAPYNIRCGCTHTYIIQTTSNYVDDDGNDNDSDSENDDDDDDNNDSDDEDVEKNQLNQRCRTTITHQAHIY